MPSKIIGRICRPRVILYFAFFVVFALWVAYQVHSYYIHVRYGFQWFEESLPSASEVAGDDPPPRCSIMHPCCFCLRASTAGSIDTVTMRRIDSISFVV